MAIQTIEIGLLLCQEAGQEGKHQAATYATLQSSLPVE